jgi:hypothetical protein
MAGPDRLLAAAAGVMMILPESLDPRSHSGRNGLTSAYRKVSPNPDSPFAAPPGHERAPTTEVFAHVPNMKILVAQIIAMNPPSCSTCAAEVQSLDQAIPGWAAGLTTAKKQSPIIVVDQWTGFDDATDTVGDGVHPNDTGFAKMAARWYPPLAQVLNGIIPPPPSPSASPSSSPQPSPSVSTPPGNSGCTATYQIASQWTGGFQGTVTVTNSSASASSTWTAIFSFADGQQITQSWNTTLTQSGAAVTAHNGPYNGSLTAGASTSFGFLSSWNTANTVPTVDCMLDN